MRQLISPNFTHEKLEPPLYKDVVDVFEDRMRYWLLVPAKKLLGVKHGDVASVALATTYIEGIEMYVSGEDSNGRSRVFFRRGFKRIFAPDAEHAHLHDPVADALYKLLRCGFVHDAMFRSGICFSRTRKDAVTVTWTRKDGRFDPKGKLGSAIINPRRFLECVELHFDNYIAELRAREPSPVKERFLAVVALKWGLNEPGPFVGMTEEEFTSGA